MKMSDKIKVAIKVRRLIDREEFEGLVSQWEVKNNSLFQKDSTGKYRESYSFDHVFGPQTKNYEVFNTVARPIVDSSIRGFNGTIFAYGETSSGKTYTMMGNHHEPGIIPQTIQYIFEALNKVQGREFLLRVSYIEIYNEKVNDLLEKGKTGLKLREVEGMTIICGVKEEVVHTPVKIMQLMERGENIRRIGETNMNERSSQSHIIFRIIIESHVPNEGEDGVVQVSHLNLVDLAGSEQLDQTEAKGDHLKEGCSINRSLSMLSHVISQLSEGQDQYVNFQDSKLTRILQSSLGGNAHTAIICAITPASVEETSSTLGFASRAIHVKNTPYINEVWSDAALLKRYARQIAKLQTEMEKTKNRNKTYEVEELESKLQEEQRRNKLLQKRIDVMKEQLIVSAATDSAGVKKRRACQWRTSRFRFAPSLPTIDENSAEFLEEECLSTAIQDLANKSFFETPLEEFELQLMDAETRLSPDSLDTPCHITFRKEKRQWVTFDDEPELTDNHSKKRQWVTFDDEPELTDNYSKKRQWVTFDDEPELTDNYSKKRQWVTFDDEPELTDNYSKKRQWVTFDDEPELTDNHCKKTMEIGSQAEAFHGTNTEFGTPPHTLMANIDYLQQEYDELREFTTLEKQMCIGEVTDLERQNKQLQKSVSDLERKVLDVNCINNKINEENKSLKERLAKETEKCNDMACCRQPVETALLQVSQEVVDLKKQLNVATQRVKHLENEKADFEMAKELDLEKLKTRNEELSLSLEDAQMEVKELAEDADDLTRTSARNVDLNKLQVKQHIEDLNCDRETNFSHIDELIAKNECLQKEIISLEEKNSMYMEQLKEKNSEREEILKYTHELKTNIVSLQKEINALQENNSMYVRQVSEMGNNLETLKQQLQDLDCQREANLTYTDELKANIVSLKKEVHSLEDDYSRYSEEVKGMDNYLQQLKKHVEDMNSGRDTNLKYIYELETNNVSLQMQIHSLKENNSLYVEKVKEKDNRLEILKQDSASEANLKYIDELKANIARMRTEIHSLEETNSMHGKQVKEMDSCLETLKRGIADLNCAGEANLKYMDEMKANTSTMQTDIHSLRERNAMHLDQLKKICNYLGKLKEQIEDPKCAREQNLEDVDELRANNECLQKEIISLEEKNSLYMEELKEKDNCLETLKQELEDIRSERATILGCGDEQQINSRMGKAMNFITEENTIYREQLKEKDSCSEALKQQIEDMNSEDQLIQMEMAVRNLEAKNEDLKKWSRKQMRKNSVLKDMLLTALGSQVSGAGSSRRVGLTRYNWGFGSDDICGQFGNKENFPGRDEAL